MLSTIYVLDFPWGQQAELRKNVEEIAMPSTQSSSSSATRVGIAIVLKQCSVLVGSRPSTAHLGDFDEFPGGKCEPGESFEACALRECYEETSLKVSAVERLHREVFEYRDRTVDLNFYLCELLPGSPAQTASPPFRWVSIEHLDGLDFPQGNEGVLRILRERFLSERAE